ncbi:unnamed protein product [Heterosigma akashiwo]|uniref:Steroid dehydrogenase n=1 Tax=Heterosigma akashiwo TaxID=2829 RepID=A0A6S9LAM5_HETAK|eukprot:CAMPEP_0194574612 /NCGR_PEP_ID=MMETSP0292-20121207/10396_1 /TAXON_ID=39354 /ORGANISM="Heterosigma akashiwo, Strain CCMP2393" /LENGTH=322 /DNA_ID=CAMNT_0039426173 /DNA_START=18 /DNA_END=986 /DNA_ORIENTATION=+
MVVFSSIGLAADIPEAFVLFFGILGAYSVLKLVLRVLGAVFDIFLAPGTNLKKYGQWAVVTGATDGIGKAYAFEMAKKGLNVYLISRTESKLQEVQKEIKEKYSKVEVEYIVCNYAKFDIQAQTFVFNELKDLDIAVLVNNVGISYPFTKYFSELSDSDVFNLVEMNVNSTTYMTRIVLPGMMAKKKGLIVNISSAASQQPSPLLAQYCAAKGYVERLSLSLDAELKGKGIRVQCQVPFYVVSKLAKIRKPSLMVPTPAAYVRRAARGLHRGGVVSPWWPHRVQGFVLNELMPGFIREKIIMSTHLAIRAKGLKKEQAAKKD